MNVRQWLGVDLAGRLTAWKRRYKSDTRDFDYRNVQCNVSPYGPNKFSVSACSYCADSTVTGMGSDNVLWFYRSGPKFLSRVEAEAHLEAEIRNAIKFHPDTRFYRRRALQLLEAGRLTEDVIYMEYCLGGTWYAAEKEPSYRRCNGCGIETEEVICPRCGEPVSG